MLETEGSSEIPYIKTEEAIGFSPYIGDIRGDMGDFFEDFGEKDNNTDNDNDSDFFIGIESFPEADAA